MADFLSALFVLVHVFLTVRPGMAASELAMGKQFSENSWQNSSMEIYSNPAHKILTIRSEIEKNGMMLISNFPGETLQGQSITSFEMSIDVSSCVNGIYILEWRSGEGTWSKKL